MSTLHEIVRAERNERSINISEASNIDGDHDGIPTGECCDNFNEEAIGAVLSLNGENATREDDYEDIGDNVL